jgi:DNA-binding transcriptional regulator LsrR (DeoR family)
MPVANPAIPAERLELSATVAQWYYIEGLSQEQIGARAGLSRIAVARLLDQARKHKIVEIAIKPPIPTVPELESRLMYSFGLRAVRVLEHRTAGDAEALRDLGTLGALVLGDFLRDSSVFGIAWGTASQAVVRALTPRTLTGVRVVQLVGSVGMTYRQIDAAEQVRSAARVLQAQHVYINAPLAVSSREVAAALREDHSIAETLELASHSDVALLGIGATEPESCTTYQAGYLALEELHELQAAGAVGALCQFYFDMSGKRTPAQRLEDCTIGISWEDLHRFGVVVAVAGGRQKARAILGALRTGIPDVLVTDDVAAELVLTFAGAQTR